MRLTLDINLDGLNDEDATPFGSENFNFALAAIMERWARKIRMQGVEDVRYVVDDNGNTIGQSTLHRDA